jgi:hypothetical protein
MIVVIENGGRKNFELSEVAIPKWALNAGQFSQRDDSELNDSSLS